MPAKDPLFPAHHGASQGVDILFCSGIIDFRRCVNSTPQICSNFEEG